MRQYAVLKNVVRGVNFGVVVKSEGNLKFFGWSEKAVEWAKWANQNKADLSQLPANVSVGEFKGMSDEMMKSIILNSEEAVAAGESIIEKKTITFRIGGEAHPNASKYPSFVDARIPGDWLAKTKAVNFKAKNFKKETALNEIALRMRMHELAFDNNSKQFVAKPNRATRTYTRSQIQSKISKGTERQFGKKIVEYANKEILKNYGLPSIKRDAIGTSTKEIVDTYVKATLGRTIGRAVRSSGRAAMPSTRSRGAAQRFISGVLDPRKRRDVDGDGMIFDGTWREMPDPTRFTQNPKLNLNRPYVPGQDTGAKTPVDDIPDLSDEAIRSEIEMIDNRPRVYDGNVTGPRMDRERKAALERELRRRARGGGRKKPTQKPQSQERRPPRPGELTPLLSSSEDMGLRTGRITRQPSSTRRMAASIQRAAQPRGTTLRSTGDRDGKTRTPAPKAGKSRGPGVGPGGKYGHGAMERKYGREKKAGDGKVWESLTPEQKKAVQEALLAEKKALDAKLKRYFSKYWFAATRKGAKKQGVVAAYKRGAGKAGGRYEKRPEDDPLDSADIGEMLLRLDQQVADGLIEKFEVSDKNTRDLKLGQDGTAAINSATNGYKQQQSTLDDAQTILNMIEDDDFSALEHLHPTTKKKIAAVIKKNEGKVPEKWTEGLATIARYAGGEERRKAPDAIDLAKERGISPTKKEKRLSLFQRLRRMDPERERAIELRAQRRNRQLGRSGVVLDPAKQLKQRKLRAAALKRSFTSKFRKQRNPEILSDDLGARRNELHPVQIAPDGQVTLRPEFMKTMAALDISFRDKNRNVSNDQLLGDLWENLGYSETPVLLREDEVRSLVAAGWQPIIRGTGHEEVESESYVEQFLTSDGRFIPGRGARAYGVGEYFAYPGGNWTGYSGNPETDRHSMLVLVPPSATIMTRSQVIGEQRAMQKISESVVNAFKVIGGRDATSKMEAGELASEIRKAAPDIEKGETRSAQIMARLVQRLEEIDKMPKTDATNTEKQEVLDTFDYLSRVSKAGEEGYFAPIIGVDAIDTNEGGSTTAPLLLHNRSIVAAFQRPMTRNEAEAMTSGTTKVWTKWKRKPRVVDADGEVEAPRPRRRMTGARRRRASGQNGDNTPDVTNNQTQPTGSAVKTTGWKRSQPQSTGSNPAALLTAPDGTEYYAKLRKQSESPQQARERMETEVLASELYKLAGIQAADLSLGDDAGEPQMLSRMIQARMPNSPTDNNAARDGFVVDAWLANWDAPLNDNIKFDSNGNPVRLDVGGSLDFRAQGGRKGSGGSTAFGDTVGEITSMQKSGTYDFTNMDPREIRRQAQKLSSVTDADIRATVSKIVSDPQRAAKLAQTLINRRNDIVSNYG